MPNPGRTLLQDVTSALRQLRRSPGFALTAIITIALGTGANTAIFTLAHAVLLRRLSVPESGQLYRIGRGDDCCINGGTAENHVYSDFSTQTYRDMRAALPEFEQLAATPRGVNGRIVIHLDPDASGYGKGRYEGLMRMLKNRLLAVPGTADVLFASYSPLEGNSWGEEIYVQGRPDPSPNESITASWDRISPGFFHSMGQPLLRGRDLQETDRADTPLVMVVNESFVTKFFRGEDPMGRRVGTDPHKFNYTIVGMVADAKYQSPECEIRPMYFRSMLQPDTNANPADTGESYSLAPHAIILRITGALQGYEAAVRRAFQDVDSKLAISDYRSMSSQVSSQLNDEHMVARLTAAFGALALLLASIGLYGVTAYSVAQRVPEIGVRMALGADRGSVLRMVVRGAMLQTAIGLALGVPAALLAGHLMQAHLYGIKGHDAATLLGACALLATAAALASLIPARRASSVDPMRALRAQ